MVWYLKPRFGSMLLFSAKTNRLCLATKIIYYSFNSEAAKKSARV